MATRFYLRNTTNSTTGLPTTKQSAQSVGATASASVNKTLDITKGTTQTSVSLIAASNYCYFTRFVSDSLGAQTISAATWTVNFASGDDAFSGPDHCRVCIYIWRPSTSTRIGFIADAIVSTVNPTSNVETSQNITVSGSAVTCQSGDVICFEAILSTLGGSPFRYYYDGATVTTTSTTVSNHASFIENPNTITVGQVLQNLTRTIGDSLSFSDSYVRLRQLNQTSADSITLTQTSTNRLTTRLRTLSDSITLTAAISRLRLLLQLIADSISFTDSELRYRGKPKTIADSITLTDSNTKLRNKLRTLSDSISISATYTRLTTRLRTIGHSLTLTAAHSRLTTRLRTIADSITISSSLSRLRLLLQTIADSISFVDSETKLRGRTRSFSDSLTLSDSTSRLTTRLKTIADSLSFADSMQSAKIKLRGFSDSLAFSDSSVFIRTKIRTISPTLALSESISKITTRLRTISHSITLTDAFLGLAGNVKYIADSLTFTDSAPIRLTTRLRTLSGSLSFVDSISRLRFKPKTIADSITISSSLSRVTTRLRTISHTLVLTDSITRTRLLLQLLADSISFTDSIIKSKGKIGLISDSLTFSSSTSRIVSRIKTIANTLVLSDSIVRIRFLLQTIADSISFSDSLLKLRSRPKTISDTITFTDSNTKQRTKIRTISATLSFTEVISKFTRRIKSIAEFMNLVATTTKIKNGGVPVPTRFYFHSTFCTISGILPTTNQSGLAYQNNVDTISNSRTMDTTKSTTLQKSLSKSVSSSFFTTSNYYITRFVSQPLGQFSIAANTWKYSISAVNTGLPSTDKAPTEGNTNPGPIQINVYVWRPSTGAKIGTIRDGATSNVVQYSDSSQRTAYTTFTGAAISGLQQTDVLVVECWMHISNFSAGNQVPTFYFDGTTVTATDGAIVSNHAAFIETPETFSFSILRNFSRDISTSISLLAAAPIRLRGFVQTISDNISLTDTQLQRRAKLRLLVPTLSLSESISKHKPIVFKTITDAVSLISDHARFKTKTRTIAENLLIISSLYRGLRTEKLKTIDHLLILRDTISTTTNKFKAFYIRLLRIRGDK